MDEQDLKKTINKNNLLRVGKSKLLTASYQNSDGVNGRSTETERGISMKTGFLKAWELALVLALVFCLVGVAYGFDS